MTPPRTIYDLEARLRGAKLEQVEGLIVSFFNEANVGLLSASPAEFYKAIIAALPDRFDRKMARRHLKKVS